MICVLPLRVKVCTTRLYKLITSHVCHIKYVLNAKNNSVLNNVVMLMGAAVGKG